MVINDDELNEYVVILWSETGRIYKILNLFRITLKGTFIVAKKYNKKFTLFININEAIEYLERFYMNQTVLDVIKEIVESDYGLTIDESITINSKIEDLGIDSLESFNLLYSLERIYKIEFENKFTPVTIKEVINEIEKLRKK